MEKQEENRFKKLGHQIDFWYHLKDSKVPFKSTVIAGTVAGALTFGAIGVGQLNELSYNQHTRDTRTIELIQKYESYGVDKDKLWEMQEKGLIATLPESRETDILKYRSQGMTDEQILAKEKSAEITLSVPQEEAKMSVADKAVVPVLGMFGCPVGALLGVIAGFGVDGIVSKLSRSKLKRKMEEYGELLDDAETEKLL